MLQQKRRILFYSKIYEFLENQSISTEDESQEFDAREEPDGEETVSKNAQSTSQQPTLNSVSTANCNAVKVPNWILSDSPLSVVFNERAQQQIDEFQINRVRQLLVK